MNQPLKLWKNKRVTDRSVSTRGGRRSYVAEVKHAGVVSALEKVHGSAWETRRNHPNRAHRTITKEPGPRDPGEGVVGQLERFVFLRTKPHNTWMAGMMAYT